MVVILLAALRPEAGGRPVVLLRLVALLLGDHLAARLRPAELLPAGAHLAALLPVVTAVDLLVSLRVVLPQGLQVAIRGRVVRVTRRPDRLRRRRRRAT